MMSKPLVKKIALMASHDWTLRATMAEFLDFLEPVFRWEGKVYRIELIRVIARPLTAGTDLAKEADLIVDRTTHWNTYYRSWAHQAMNSLARMVNHCYTFSVYDKHSTYDLMARAIHPRDRFPKTVLLPQFQPWTEDQNRQWWWQQEQQLILENTDLGFDPARKQTDWRTVEEKLAEARRTDRRTRVVREDFYYSGPYMQEVVEQVFGNRFPLYLKKAYGGGGTDVYRVNDMEELYARYDRTGTEAYHLQEAIEPYDMFYRAMGIGPIVFPMIFQPEQPLHQHYSPDKPTFDQDLFHRLESYVLFINSYHRWTYNSFECLLKDGHLHPIDFANACPDSQFTSLHVHFPLLVCSLVKWLSFCAVTGKDMRPDIEMKRYLTVLNNPEISQEEKFAFCRKASEEYFEIDKFREFCARNLADIEEKMVAFYDKRFDEIIRFAMEFSNFPEQEQESFYRYYKEMMEKHWRPNPTLYLTPYILKDS
jgi:hypothetical protein